MRRSRRSTHRIRWRERGTGAQTMRLMMWVMTGAVLTAICVPIDLRAEEPSTRPAPAGERRGGPDKPRPGGPGAPGGGGGGGARRMGPAPGELIEEFRTIAKDLNLTDEQKTKVEAALKTAAEEFKTLRDDDTIDPRDRRTRAEEIFGTMRKDVSGALTEEQRQTLR